MKSITDDVKFSRPIKIVIDAGNGIAGPTAAALFKTLGAEVEELYTNVDGNFLTTIRILPNRLICKI